MTLFERVSYLAKKQKISLPALSEKLGFSSQALYKWKTSSPKAENLQIVADYFNVSTDYLLGRTDNISQENNSLTKQVMMRMDTDGLSEKDLNDLENEMERFFSWRLQEIKRERGE